MIQSLIDKQDTFEIVRDQIAQILADEVASQMALATAAAKDPDDWKLRVFAERSNPLEQFLNPDETNFDDSPLVNVFYDNSSFNAHASNVVEQQKSETIYNIDCYGFGRSRGDGAGHLPGDELAALDTHRAVRLVRNILMASTYTFLGLQGLVWRRWMQGISSFQPQIAGRNVQQVVAARLTFSVHFTEFSPQYEPETLETIVVDLKRAEDGQVLATAQFDYPITP